MRSGTGGDRALSRCHRRLLCLVPLRTPRAKIGAFVLQVVRWRVAPSVDHSSVGDLEERPRYRIRSTTCPRGSDLTLGCSNRMVRVVCLFGAEPGSLNSTSRFEHGSLKAEGHCHQMMPGSSADLRLSKFHTPYRAVDLRRCRCLQ